MVFVVPTVMMLAVVAPFDIVRRGRTNTRRGIAGARFVASILGNAHDGAAAHAGTGLAYVRPFGYLTEFVGRFDPDGNHIFSKVFLIRRRHV
jgi:hypothetical protein